MACLVMSLRSPQLITAAAAVLLVSSSSCNRSPEERGARFLKAGTEYMRQKNYPRAIIELRNAVKQIPRSMEAHHQLGVAYEAMRNYPEAVRHFWLASEIDPSNTDVQLRLAEILEAFGGSDLATLAQQRARAVLAAKPGDPEALRSLALAEWRLGYPKSAEEHLTEALRAAPGHLRALLSLAMIQFETGRAAEAERTLLSAVATAPESAKALVALGQLYLMTARPAEAERQFRRVLERDPLNAQAMLELARLESQAGHREEASTLLKRLSQLPEDTYRTAHAQFLLEAGQKGAAIAELEQLLRDYPKNREIRSRLVDAYFAAGNTGAAEKILTEALRDNPRDVDALEQRSRTYLVAGRIAEAQRSAEEVLRFRPEWAQPHYLLAQVHRRRGDTQSYRAQLETTINLAPGFLNARLELSQLLRNARSAGQALDVLDKMPEAQKSEFPAIVERTWVMLALGRHEEARALVAGALAIARTSDVLLQDGLLKVRAGQYQSARASLEEALGKSPDNLQVMEAICFSFAGEGKPGAATAWLRQHTVANPASAAAHFFLGTWLENAGDRKAARAAYGEAARVDPKFVRAEIATARLDMLEGHWDQAKAAVDRVLAANPRDVDGLLARGMLQEATSQSSAAVSTYRALLEIAPRHTTALNNLAVLLTASPATVDEALGLAQRAKQEEPDNPAIDDTLGWVYYHKGLYPLAIQHLKRAAGASRDHRTRYHLAMAYHKSGDNRLAKETLKLVDRNLPELKDGLPDFAR